MHTIPNVPDSLTREIYAALCSNLPTPSPDTPAARAAREERALTFLATLVPENSAEAELAVHIVAADSHSKDCLRAASRPGCEPDQQRRCRAQAATMMRAMQTGVRLLQRTQALREKAEAAHQPAAMERAGYWFHEITPPPPAATPVTTEPAPPVAASANAPADQRDFGELTEAEQYALLYPDRAALIRAERGLPPNPSFGPPTPELAEDIVNSNSPILRALDRPPAAATASA